MTDAYRITLITSEFDTLKAGCEDLWNKLAWYINADDG